MPWLLKNGPVVSTRPTAKVTICTKLGMKLPGIIQERELGLFLLFLPAPVTFLIHPPRLCEDGQFNKRKRGKKTRQEGLEPLAHPFTAPLSPLNHPSAARFFPMFPTIPLVWTLRWDEFLCFHCYIMNFLKTGPRNVNI